MIRKPRLVATLILLLTWSSMNVTTAPEATARGRGPCSETRYEVNRTMSSETRTTKLKALTRCVFAYFGISDEVDTAYNVIGRESGYRPWATNPVSAGVCRPYSSTVFGSCGLFQMLARFHRTRVATYLHERWFPGTWPHVPILQARANVMIAAGMIRAHGWCDWTAPNYCA